jgi:crotonobetainyl-CoA:carnitine CoA-transferase CaiB-like acyl-CoA transferase
VSGLPAYGMFAASDGVVALGTITEQHFWDATCTALGLEELCGLPLAEQVGRGDELRERFAAAIGRLRRDDAVERLLAAGAPASPVLSREEMLVDPHLRARGTVIDGPDGRPWLSHPVRFERHPARGPAAPPAAGEHDAEGFGSTIR